MEYLIVFYDAVLALTIKAIIFLSVPPRKNAMIIIYRMTENNHQGYGIGRKLVVRLGIETVQYKKLPLTHISPKGVLPFRAICLQI